MSDPGYAYMLRTLELCRRFHEQGHRFTWEERRQLVRDVESCFTAEVASLVRALIQQIDEAEHRKK